MINSYGRAGGGGPHLPVQHGRAVYHQIGPFTATLAPTLIQKAAGHVPSTLWVGLLAVCPNPDGDGYQELIAPGYDRQTITCTPDSSAFDTNAEGVAFHVPLGAVVTHLGLFDAHGRLLFYGRLIGRMTRQELPCEFVFPARSLKLKRFQATKTDGPRPQLGGAPLPRQS